MVEKYIANLLEEKPVQQKHKEDIFYRLIVSDMTAEIGKKGEIKTSIVPIMGCSDVLWASIPEDTLEEMILYSSTRAVVRRCFRAIRHGIRKTLRRKSKRRRKSEPVDGDETESYY